MRALTVTSRLLPAKSMSPITRAPSALRAVTASTRSRRLTVISTLGLTSSDTVEATARSMART
jgi:hypothetical protein